MHSVLLTNPDYQFHFVVYKN
jgi:hypothetical protein